MAKEFKGLTVTPRVTSSDFTTKVVLGDLGSPRISFGGKHFEQFVHVLSRADYVEFFIEDSPIGRPHRTSWRFRPEVMHPEKYRGRGMGGFRPIIAILMEEHTYRTLNSLLPRELMLDIRFKGAAYLYLYLGFCCLDGDLFGSYYGLFGIEDYRSHEDNFLVLNNIILTMIENRELENCFWALQKEAQKTFLDLFI